MGSGQVGWRSKFRELQEIRKVTLGSREVTGPLLDRYVVVVVG